MSLNPFPKTSYFCAVAFASIFMAGQLGAAPVSPVVRQGTSPDVSRVQTKRIARPAAAKPLNGKKARTKSKAAKKAAKKSVRKKTVKAAAVPLPRPVLSPEKIRQIKAAFNKGHAEQFTASQLVAAGLFTYVPLKGGTYERNHAVEYIVLHSTETETPADAKRVIRSWNNRGRTHPGAQYVLDRDGGIYQTVDPAQTATMHVNANKTAKYGIGNRNSIGIEIVRAGKQKYTKVQLDSLRKLVLYLQHRFAVDDEKLVGHGQIQPDNRTDPVNFEWERFLSAKKALHTAAHGGKPVGHLD